MHGQALRRPRRGPLPRVRGSGSHALVGDRRVDALPVGGRGGADRDFLANARTPEKERARLKRINGEFIRGFKGLFHVGPAVTVFGSARFKATHPYYVTDSPKEAMDLILRSLPAAVRSRLKPRS
jgi:hypothetical protein